MEFVLVEAGTLKSYDYATYLYGRHVLHRITVTGPISLKERIPLYERTLKLTPEDAYFCIVDNNARHENQFSFDDIKYLDDLLIKSGIRVFYGVTITQDSAYEKMVDLANTNAELNALKGQLYTTADENEAEAFILSKLRPMQ